MPPELLADQGYSRTKKGNLFDKHYSRWQLLNNLPPISSLWKRVKNPVITHSRGGRHQACSYWGRLVIRQSQLFDKIISPKICLAGEAGTPQLLQAGHPQLSPLPCRRRVRAGRFLERAVGEKPGWRENPNNFICILLPICLGSFGHFLLLEKVCPYVRTLIFRAFRLFWG